MLELTGTQIAKLNDENLRELVKRPPHPPSARWRQHSGRGLGCRTMVLAGWRIRAACAGGARAFTPSRSACGLPGFAAPPRWHWFTQQDLHL